MFRSFLIGLAITLNPELPPQPRGSHLNSRPKKRYYRLNESEPNLLWFLCAPHQPRIEYRRTMSLLTPAATNQYSEIQTSVPTGSTSKSGIKSASDR